MIGRSRSSGAISLLNALFDGIGSAVGVGLWCDVEAEAHEGPPGLTVHPAESGTPIVRSLHREAVDRFGRVERAWTLRIRSEVPQGCGLKSSSAVGAAVYRATARALGAEPSDLDTARAAAFVAREIGQSATGAFDDACAATSAGIWLTDNRTDTVLNHWPAPEGLGLLVCIPPGIHPPSPGLIDRLAGAGGSTSLALLRSGRFWEAMESNSQAVERTLGYDGALRQALHEAGALAYAVSGLGPARAVVAPPDRFPSIREVLPAILGTIIQVEFTDQHRGTESP